MTTVINLDLDLGPNFLAQASQIAGEMVCILAPAALSDARTQDRVRELMWGQGRDCRACRGCQVGTAS